jgi:CubicO group peptidase (beta-lactamase class C family)
VATDPVLAAALRSRLSSRDPRFAVVTVSGGESALESIGVSVDADFEIGSISKGITGLLYADACDRGELGPATTLGELLPLAGSAVAGLKLAAVSRHSSGLPRLAPGGPGPASRLNRTVSFLLHGTNPYGGSLGELLEQARAVRLQAPRPRYSNLGFELLGHAVAAAAGTNYRDLVAARLSAPLALASVYMPATPGELGPDALIGSSRSGRPKNPGREKPWPLPAASGHPFATWRGSPRHSWTPRPRGTTALDPVASFVGPAARIGAAWITLEVKGRQITWHNGATGGFRSWIGLDREAGTGVVLLSATSASVDRHGFALLQELTERR